MRKRIVAACVCFATAFAGTATAGPNEDAAAAYGRGDYAAAFLLWHAQAELGDAAAQEVLGFMYHDGEGVSKDLVRAYMWFYLAASNYPAGEQDFLEAIEARDLTADEMTPAQIAEARAMAQACQAQQYKNCD